MSSLLTPCLVELSSAIGEVSKRLSTTQVENALKLIESCHKNNSKLIISGVGKSGIVARKIASTFSSIGFTACYLNPLDALHGDIGIVSMNDVSILLSNSGETSEILQILPHLKLRGSSTIAIVGKLNSSLSRSCDVTLNASVDKEVCPLNLAPTTSTTVSMSIGDALAVVSMQRRGITSNDFAINHPAGSLGKKLTLKVSDLMIPINKLTLLKPHTEFSELVSQINSDGIGACAVEDSISSGKICGLITDGDLRRALESNEPSNWCLLTSTDLMTKLPIIIDPNSLAYDAIQLMETSSSKPISVLPVVTKDENIIGMLKLHDLIQSGLF